MNRINKVFQKDGTIMSIYFTAGFPAKNDTLSIIKELDSAGVEMIEIGLPFSVTLLLMGQQFKIAQLLH